MIDGLVEAGSRLVQLAIAFLLALPIAWDREHKERSAGLRTFTLVAVSTCGFLMAARSSLGPSVDAESRVWQGLLTGIGFIGSGAILKTDGTVHGTATAASIWNTAAVGAAVAYGKYRHRRRSEHREFRRVAVAGAAAGQQDRPTAPRELVDVHGSRSFRPPHGRPPGRATRTCRRRPTSKSRRMPTAHTLPPALSSTFRPE